MSSARTILITRKRSADIWDEKSESNLTHKALCNKPDSFTPVGLASVYIRFLINPCLLPFSASFFYRIRDISYILFCLHALPTEHF